MRLKVEEFGGGRTSRRVLRGPAAGERARAVAEPGGQVRGLGLALGVHESSEPRSSAGRQGVPVVRRLHVARGHGRGRGLRGALAQRCRHRQPLFEWRATGMYTPLATRDLATVSTTFCNLRANSTILNVLKFSKQKLQILGNS